MDEFGSPILMRACSRSYSVSAVSLSLDSEDPENWDHAL